MTFGRKTKDGRSVGADFGLRRRSRRGATLRWAALLALVACSVIRLPSALQAQSAPLPPVVSSDWLATEIARPGLVVLQLGTDSSFRAGHIPGSLHLDFNRVIVAPPVQGGLRMELPSAAALESGLQSLGVRTDSRIVLVFDSPAQMLPVGRTFFTLEWAGLRGRVSVLDGGLPAWRASMRSVSSGAGRSATTGDVRLSVDASRVATRDSAAVAINTAGTRLVDARTAPNFTPAELGGSASGGHIASAVSLPFTSITDADGRFKPREEIERLLIATGVIPGERTVAYCNTGFQASWIYVALRHIGVDAQLYDGSFEDWSRDESLPVNGARAGRP